MILQISLAFRRLVFLFSLSWATDIWKIGLKTKDLAPNTIVGGL